MFKPVKNEIVRITQAFGYSVKGIVAAYKYENAFRIEVYFAFLFVPLSFFIGQTFLQVALLLSVLFLVMLVELLNSAVESVVDRIGSEHHELSGRAKDQASAAVLFALIVATIVWAAIIYQNFF